MSSDNRLWDGVYFPFPPSRVPTIPTGPVTVPNGVLLRTHPGKTLLEGGLLAPGSHTRFNITTSGSWILLKDNDHEIFGTVTTQPTTEVLVDFVIENKAVDGLLCVVPYQGYDLIDDLWSHHI